MKNFYSRILSVVFTASSFALAFAQYSNGYIVSHEGNFGTPNAEISYINENNVVTNNVYALANNGAAIGDVLQSLSFEGDRVFMVVNNSNKIIVANRSTFVKTAEITTEIRQPRYSTVANGKIYTTNAGSSGSGKYVSVHNATTFAFIKKITLTNSSEEIITVNDKVYVMKSYFGGGKSIDVIDSTTDEIVKNILLSAGLQSLKVKDNAIFALCSNSTGSTVYKVNTSTDNIESSISNTTVKNAQKFALDNDNLYIASGLNVFGLSTDLQSFGNTALFTVSSSQGWDEFYGFAAIDGKIFQASANGFVAGSTVNEFSSAGTLVNSFTTTMGANGIYKNVYDSTLSSSTNSLAKISLYPNPAREILFIKNAENATYKILDVTGKLVKGGIYKNGIAVSTLSKGIYLIQITEKNQQSTHKFMVK